MFGQGSLESLGELVSGLGRRALVVTDRNIAQTPGFARGLELLAAAGVRARVFDNTPPDLPPSAVRECLAAAVDGGSPVEVLVGFGGGSPIDLAKVTSLLLTYGGPLHRFYGEGLVPGPVAPVVAVSTTAGTGSEVTPVAVVSDPARRLKVGVSDLHLIPRVAICDPALTVSCPGSVTSHVGMDALTHAIEAFLAPPRPVSWNALGGEVFRGSCALSDPFAVTAIERIGGALERAVARGDDMDARAAMHYASLCAGIAFGHAGTAGAHALQYPVGAATGTPHGLGVGLLLPYVLDHVRGHATGRLATVAVLLGVADAATDADTASLAAVVEVRRLAAAIGLPRTLADIGVSAGDLPAFADDAATITRLLKNSPRPLDRQDLLTILQNAWSGVVVTEKEPA